MPFTILTFFLTFLLRVFQKFSNPNGCCTLKTHSCVCDSFVSSLIQLLMNNQTTTFQQFHQLPYHLLSYTLVMTHQHTQHLVFSVFLSITNKMQRYTIFFITVNALHVSGGFSTHHQELKNCTHSIWYMSILLAATASDSSKQA